jgi:hypothetical protein
MRAVAAPDALDRARWSGPGVQVIRVASDEALGLGATGVEVEDEDAIVEQEIGFSVARLGADDLEAVRGHVEWPVPVQPGALAQGKIAGVPAKLVLGRPPLLVVQTAYAEELARRLGW